jgi:hypothetical protein
MPWRDDLEMGDKYQHLMLDILEYDEYEMAKGNFKPYDIKIKNKSDTYTIEVKADRKTKTTGNVVIEFECNKKPSGITTTEADYWAYFIDGTEDYFLIPTDDIRNAIKEGKYSRTVKGGDGFRANMYVFPGSVFGDFRDCYKK